MRVKKNYHSKWPTWNRVESPIRISPGQCESWSQTVLCWGVSLKPHAVETQKDISECSCCHSQVVTGSLFYLTHHPAASLCPELGLGIALPQIRSLANLCPYSNPLAHTALKSMIWGVWLLITEVISLAFKVRPPSAVKPALHSEAQTLLSSAASILFPCHNQALRVPPTHHTHTHFPFYIFPGKLISLALLLEARTVELESLLEEVSNNWNRPHGSWKKFLSEPVTDHSLPSRLL